MKQNRSKNEVTPKQASLAGTGIDTVSCCICHAVYTPVQLDEDLVRGSSFTIESTFLSTCHFCFNCHRPACPQCWDTVHEICGECAYKAHLPFRQETTSQRNTLLSYPRKGQEVRRTYIPSIRFVCTRSGNFAHGTLDIDMLPTLPESDRLTHRQRRQQANSRRRITLPIDVSDVETRPGGYTSSPRGRVTLPIDVSELETKPEQFPATSHRSTTLPIDVSDFETRPPGYAFSPQARITFPIDVSDVATRPERPIQTRSIQRIGRFLLMLLSIGLILAMLLITSALISSNVNFFIVSVLHIDIRTEMLQLWHFIMQFHG